MFEASHIHPLLVHFPIALLLVGFLFDFVFLFIKKDHCLSKAGMYLMILGTLGAAVALTSGFLFTSALTDGDVAKVYDRHKIGALFTLTIMCIASVVRIIIAVKKKEETSLKWIPFGLYFLGTACLGFTGFMGGTMVYKYLLGM
jgi:uncharacterized membrane protein